MSCLTALKEKGFKLTPQRMLIADVIHQAKGHLTAEEIISYVQTKMPGVNKSTIYRTLDLLEKAGSVYRSELGDHAIYHHDEEGHHHHLVCRKCGVTIDLDEDFFASVKDSLARRYGFRVDLKHIVITGLCKSCGEKGR